MSEPKKSGDAQDTLGTVLDSDRQYGRDAIHVAVVPAVADMPMMPGTKLGLVDGRWSPAAPVKLGVVDPFLSAFVRTGQQYWVLLYPRTITGLRHVWTHPDIPEEGK